jgi:hypothetical protein
MCALYAISGKYLVHVVVHEGTSRCERASVIHTSGVL